MPTEPPHRSRTPLRVWIGLTIAVGLDVPVQIVWKAMMLKYGDWQQGHAAAHLSRQILWFPGQLRLWLLMALWGCQFLDWMWVLGNADLSFAQPFTALSYAAVGTFAVLYIPGEHMTVVRGIGIGLILVGVILIGSSEHRTTVSLPVEPS
jgi:drug/metabolite transporter (DMT)-like permease